MGTLPSLHLGACRPKSAATDRAEAQRLAAKLAAKEQGRVDRMRSLTYGAYITQQRLPANRLRLATSTYGVTSAT